MTRYLLDTCVWSDIIRRRSPQLLTRFAALKTEQVFLSPVVLGELLLGYYKGDQTPTRKRVIDTLVASTTRLIVDEDVAHQYARLRAELEKAGTPIGRNDTWIAAEALQHKLTVVTDNMSEFKRVKGLKLENWVS